MGIYDVSFQPSTGYINQNRNYSSTPTFYPLIIPETYNIGDTYGCGIIFYIDGTTLYICDPGTLGDEFMDFHFNGTYIGSSGTTIGTGYINTKNINAHTGEVVDGNLSAGFYCWVTNTCGLGGNQHWYLPSKDELAQMYIQRTVIGNFVSGTYWSSSEIGTTTAYTQNFSTGTQTATSKLSNCYVRAIRTINLSDITPPSIPQNVYVYNDNINPDLQVNWDFSTDNIAVVGYDIYRMNSLTESSFYLVNTVGSTISSWTDYSLANGTYEYYVIAFDAGGNFSNPSDTTIGEGINF